jgi:hypothetical protein
MRAINSRITMTARSRQVVFIALLSLVTLTATGGTDDPASRLKSARSLRCSFTSSVDTWVRSGHRTIEQTNEKGTATYDNIDIVKGTARIIANGGAGDISVWLDHIPGSLWMIERTLSGNVVVTTVFPMYAEGTDEFVVLEARHWIAITGQIVVGQDSYGTCRILD